jgi:hypothetical protein
MCEPSDNLVATCIKESTCGICYYSLSIEINKKNECQNPFEPAANIYKESILQNSCTSNQRKFQ